jgi:phosphatidate cytidylyltransferase
MKKLAARLMVFFIGIPLVICIVIFLPHYHHLVVNIIVILFSSLGALEFSALLRKKELVIAPVEAAILGAVAPAAMTIVVTLDLNGQIVPAAYILGASWLLVSRVFQREDKLKHYTSRTAAGFSVLFYPGLFMVWIIRMSLIAESSIVILIFFLTVAANDSIAWATGMLFGKKNRGIIPASPNKSIAGFAGGITASLLAGAGGVIFFPQAFIADFLPDIFSGLLLGFCTGIAAALGDLGESALKRSSGIKDSGSIMPGRGGVLDSIDSISLAAPVFYVLYRILFK